MVMQVACSQVGPMRKMMRKPMLYMQRWTRGWMKDAKKEGYKKMSLLFNCLSMHSVFVFKYIMDFILQESFVHGCRCILGS